MAHGLVRLKEGLILPPPRRPGMLSGLSSAGGGSPGGPVLPPPSAKWTLLDGFEDDNITEYSGGSGLLETDSGESRHGNYALRGLFPSDNSIYRTDITCAQGDLFTFWAKKVMTGSNAELIAFGFGCTDTVTGYWAAFYFAANKLQLWEDKPLTGSLRNEVGFVFADDTWYLCEIRWRTTGQMTVNIGATSFTATDNTYTTGGFGWFSYVPAPGLGVSWVDHARIKVGGAG